jgi:ribosomal protein L9
MFIINRFIEGSLKVKLPTIWTDEKQRWEESEKRREEERRSNRESLRRKTIQVREKVGKSGNSVFFQ